ncbi:MAG: beta-ketoacyl-ACP synthase II [Myxococcales bacterium]
MERSRQERIVVTGVGVISPMGLSAPTSFDALLRAESGIAALEPALGSEYDVRIGGQVRHFDSLSVLGKRYSKRHARCTHFALAAAQEAVRSAGLGDAGYEPERIGVLFGTGMGGLEAIAEVVDTVRTRGPSKVSPFGLPAAIPNIPSATIAEMFGAMGPNHCIATACASGAHAVGEGAGVLRLGRADAMIVGGTEAVLVPSAISAFTRMQALSRRNESPREASRPFDAARDGFVMAEGAAALVLERFTTAQARGAPVLGELAGYGSSCDAYHVARPREDGVGAQRAMRAALREAEVSPESVDYLNAHGTGTSANDTMESLAIRSVFGAADGLWVSATKSMSGHMLGAAGAFEAVVSLLALRRGVVPPTINLERPDPSVGFDLVPFEARPRRLGIAMSNSFAFGGHNVSLVFRAV